jgi:hypothetical protein
MIKEKVMDKTGGYAFARPRVYDPDYQANGNHTSSHPGMTLRDWYAGMAMQAIISNPNENIISAIQCLMEEINVGLGEATASMAGEYADAMIKEKSKNEKTV